MPCLSCGGRVGGCEDCEATGWRPMGPDYAAEDAERTTALRETLKGDEVYVVYRLGGPLGNGILAFGHEEDAQVYAERYLCAAEPEPVKVLDHADARRLIEQEGRDG